MGKKIKKLVVVTGLIMMVSLVGKTDKAPFGITAYASEQTLSQSSRWEGQGDIWRVKDNAGGYLKNSWFQDLDGSWYMLGADGIMYSGLVTDQSTGKTYLLNTNHDGTYGRMLTVNGTYAVNGVNVYLEFNQAHDGSYGAITSGLTEARSTGIKETGLASIPTDSTETSQNQNSNGYKSSWEGNSDGETNGLGMDIDMSKYDPADMGGSTGYMGDHWY